MGGTNNNPRPRVYLAGPIAGKPNGNRTVFAMFADAMHNNGWEPVNPHEIDHSHPGWGLCRGEVVPRSPEEILSNAEAGREEHRYGCYMSADIKAMLTCSAALFLPGWYESRGAKVERIVAQICGLKIIEWNEVPDLNGHTPIPPRPRRE